MLAGRLRRGPNKEVLWINKFLYIYILFVEYIWSERDIYVSHI